MSDLKYKNAGTLSYESAREHRSAPIARGTQMHRSNVFSFKSISAGCIHVNIVNIITFASRLLETTRISVV